MLTYMRMTALMAAVVAGAGLAVAADTVEEVRSLDNFEEIAVLGPIDVHVVAGEDFSVRVRTEKGFLDVIETRRRGRRLKIRLEQDWRSSSPDVAEVYVSLPLLTALQLSGSGAIDAAGVDATDLRIRIAGSGDINIAGGSLGRVEATILGSGDLTASGACNTLEASIRGSGDMALQNLICEHAEVSIAGSGDVIAHARTLFAADIAGSGDITVYGAPEVTRRAIRGSGSIKLR